MFTERELKVISVLAETAASGFTPRVAGYETAEHQMIATKALAALRAAGWKEAAPERNAEGRYEWR